MIKYYSKTDGVRSAKDPIMINYNENEYLDQYRDLKIFYLQYVVEHLLFLIKTYDKMETYYLIQIFDLRLQVD